ncbi:MAG: hypothetical protein K8F91_19425, partial [Candidatus Obscuribacterales bacterium]|nr:hypothetical protein [Candidatus Obscuribacterales bacterium]
MRVGRSNWTAFIVVFFSLGCLQIAPAQARLGEKVKTYIVSHKKSLKLKDITIKQEIKYYAFSVMMNVDEVRSAPGFACGVTVTARAGEIIGESMAIKFGEQPLKANNLAVEHGYRFVNDALGRNSTAIAESSEKK